MPLHTLRFIKHAGVQPGAPLCTNIWEGVTNHKEDKKGGSDQHFIGKIHKGLHEFILCQCLLLMYILLIVLALDILTPTLWRLFAAAATFKSDRFRCRPFDSSAFLSYLK